MRTRLEDENPHMTSPVDQAAENVTESSLINTLEILIASGKVTKDDVLSAWKLGFVA